MEKKIMNKQVQKNVENVLYVINLESTKKVWLQKDFGLTKLKFDRMQNVMKFVLHPVYNSKKYILVRQ